MTTSTTARKIAAASPKAKGIAVLVFLLLFALVAFNRPRVDTTLASGETLNADFSRDYKLRPYQSVVKLAGVQVGKVTGIESTDDGATVKMKLDDGVLEKLGTEPEANVRPTLVLGGNYYVELVRGGETGQPEVGSTIPEERTSVPVELDQVLSAVTPDANKAVGGTVKSLDGTTGPKGRKAIQRLIDNGPATLGGAKEVLRGLRGRHPQDDLTNVVTGLQHTSAALTREGGQWVGILDDLASTSAALADGAEPLAGTIADAPETLSTTREGLADLDGTLDRLEKTAQSFRPSAEELAPLLADLDPVLGRARPVLKDARKVVRDARPLVEDLVPLSGDATEVLDDVRGPVLDRLSGPVTTALLSPWHGTGVYEGGGNDHLLYEETGYLLADFADVFKFHDKNGAMGRLMAGVGLSTPGGLLSYSLEEMLEGAGLQLPKGPQEGANKGEPAPPLGSTPSYPGDDGLLGGANQPLDDLKLPLVNGDR